MATEIPWAKKKSVDLPDDDFDIDELLAKLTPEELETLSTELIDPDDSCLPPSDRCRYKTDKAPTGKFNRKALLDFLEKKAREEKDWVQNKDYIKEIKGKVWKPKEQEKVQLNDDDDVETEWDEVLANATEDELVDLAAILGFHEILNQEQYHAAFIEQKSGAEMIGSHVGGGFSGVAKFSNLKLVPDEPPNDTDVETSLEQVKDNDPKLVELNLNNIKNISIERLIEFAEALKTNTKLEKIYLSNTRANDKVALAFANGVRENKTLTVLNIESNFIQGPTIIELFKAINVHQSLLEFRIANQRQRVLGNKIEMQLSKLVTENKSLLKFGIGIETPDARIRISEHIKKNNDRLRKIRIGADPDEGYEPPKEEPKKAPATRAAPPPVKKVASPEEESEEESEEETESESEEE